MSTTKRIAKRLLAVILTVMMLMSMVTIGMTSASAAKVDLAETGATLNASGNGRLYFNMSAVSWWNTSSAGGGNYAYFFNNSTGKNAWSAKAQVYSGSVYYVNIPAGDWAGVILTRNSVTSGPTWDNKWNQTGDITMSNTSNYISKFADGSTSVTWGTQKPASTATLTSSAATIELGATANLTAALSSNTNLNTVKSVAYSVSPAGATVSGNTFTATEAGTYTVTATVTYNPYDYAGITSTTTATTTITVEAPVVEETTTTPASSSNTEESSSSEVEGTTSVPATSDPAEEKNTIDLAWAEDNGLYAYANITDEPNTEAWQRWVDVSGTRRFYLPASASDTEVLIYSTYTSDVTVNGVTIAPGEYAKVPYTEGTTYTCSGATDQSVKIYKTDAEASLFINAADGMTAKYDNTDSKVDKDASFDIMAFFRSGSKNQEIGKAGGAVADANGVIAEQVKKLKGRGNTTWDESKKPFNVTFKNEISIDGMDSFDKWSLLANAKDDSLLRNRLVYDMANEVNMEYACDSRFVDLFISGRYEGSYQLVQKIEMNEGSVMSNLNEVEVDSAAAEYKADNFDFVLELDTASNAANAGDLTFTTSRGQVMTHKIPDEPTAEQVKFMKDTYQAVENALYGDDIATLETLVDMDDLAKAYLINEISKNIDSGVTSCYFTYSAEAGKFFLSPVWDFDNAVGNLSSGRNDVNGNSLSLTKTSGWYAKEMAHFDEGFTGKRSVFSMACYTTTKTAAGETFNDIVKRVWDAEFADLIDILEGTKTGDGRLKSLDGYAESLTKSGKWNFEKGWTLKQDWTASRSSLTMYDYDTVTNSLTSTTNNYSHSSVTDMRNYAGDWLISRLNWLAAQYSDVETEVPDGYTVVYFENNWVWPDVAIHVWGSALQADTTWPGTPLTKVVGQNSDGYDIYEVIIPTDATGILFNGTGEYGFEQSTDINGGWYDGICYYMTYDSATNTKPCGTYDYKVPVETTTSEVTTTSTPVEDTTASKPATKDEETTTPAETTTAGSTETTMTIYFENNWAWPDLTIYWWGSTTGENPQWNTQKMDYVDTTKDGYDRYVMEVPTDITGLIFAGTGDYGFEQSDDITGGWYDGICYYMTYDSETKTK
ncbi:MAG: CotH kinase family protein, partial [Clostridia bacterium]|nr:CotH kinase family protein [Clostridia bacterium]